MGSRCQETLWKPPYQWGFFLFEYQVGVVGVEDDVIQDDVQGTVDFAGGFCV